MIPIAFDLISDLHVESWPSFDWEHQATSPICVVAGDISRNINTVKKTLQHLGENYQLVLYIDGNEEHKDNFESIDDNYETFKNEFADIKNVVYLQDAIPIVHGVAFVSANAWWTYDWDSVHSPKYVQDMVRDYYKISDQAAESLKNQALMDVVYLENTIQKLQTFPDVKKIVVVTHTVPHGNFIKHDFEISETYRINASVNSYVTAIFDQDTENKIKAWCFGHYHWPIDQTINAVRYACNPRGRKQQPQHQDPYFPLRIEI
jgi:hypothetical protein